MKQLSARSGSQHLQLITSYASPKIPRIYSSGISRPSGSSVIWWLSLSGKSAQFQCWDNNAVLASTQPPYTDSADCGLSDEFQMTVRAEIAKASARVPPKHLIKAEPTHLINTGLGFQLAIVERSLIYPRWSSSAFSRPVSNPSWFSVSASPSAANSPPVQLALICCQPKLTTQESPGCQ